MHTIRLPSASPTEDFRALQEVKDFATTDMGWGGKDRWTYRILSDDQVLPELSRLSQPRTDGIVDSVMFQPCLSFEARSQDRHVVDHWDLPGGRWTFCGIFDGHCSHETADYAVARLPNIVRTSLEMTLRGNPTAQKISRVLSEAITHLDNAITQEFLSLLPEDPSRLSSRDIDRLLSRHPQNAHRLSKIVRCTRGSTALITLTDPRRENLWVANLGDSQTVLVSKSARGPWLGARLSQIHNGNNDRELSRISKEHPTEHDCIRNRRVLGYLSPTRALGDTWMKLSPKYSSKIFSKLTEWSSMELDEFMTRNINPPYISNIPDVIHHRLRRSKEDPLVDVAVVSFSDGLPDLYETDDEQYMLSRLANVVGDFFSRSTKGRNSHQNVALKILRDAIGEDLHRASRTLTVEMEEKWCDDTTVLVQSLLV